MFVSGGGFGNDAAELVDYRIHQPRVVAFRHHTDERLCYRGGE